MRSFWAAEGKRLGASAATATAVLALCNATPAEAIVGCLTPMEELAARSDVVVVGTIESVDTVEIGPCPVLEFDDEGWRSGDDYRRCGTVYRFLVRVADRLRGQTSDTISIVAPSPQALSLSCDDRPEPEAMVGLWATLFLEREEQRLWLVDGPNSMHVGWSTTTQDEIDRVRALLERVPRRPGPSDPDRWFWFEACGGRRLVLEATLDGARIHRAEFEVCPRARTIGSGTRHATMEIDTGAGSQIRIRQMWADREFLPLRVDLSPSEEPAVPDMHLARLDRAIETEIVPGLVIRTFPAELELVNAVVEEFCGLDADGVRLRGSMWPRIAHLVTREDEAGWDSAVVVKEHRVTGTRIDRDEAQVDVEYSLYGLLGGDTWYPVGIRLGYGEYVSATETVTYELARIRDEWRIVRPILQPHVSRRAILPELESATAAARDAGQPRIELEDALRKIEALPDEP